MNNGFPKSARLKSYKLLQQLFKEGKTIRKQNIRLIYLINANTDGLKCGVGVSGKNFKKAVDRNRIKRLLREAYRLQQHELKNFALNTKLNFCLFFLYTGKEMPIYSEVYENVGLALQRLLERANADIPENS